MLNGIFVSQNPLAKLAIAQSASPPTHNSFDPLRFSRMKGKKVKVSPTIYRPFSPPR